MSLSPHAMLRRAAVLAALVVLALWAWRPHAPQRTELDDGAHRRIVAVGDLHGDYAHALAVLRAAGVVAADSADWVGGRDVLVSTGDTVDRGDDTIRIYELYQSLCEQSVRAGGKVITLLGNHEMMNAMHDWRYVTPGDLASFGGAAARRHAMSADGWLGREWLAHYNATARVALLPPDARASRQYVSFVHGGIAPAFATLGTERLNELAQSLLAKALADPAPDGYLPANATKAEAALWSADGPFWFRGYATEGADRACAWAASAAASLGVQALVMGHTPHRGGVVERCERDRIYVIDTGISRAYGGKLSAMVIDSYLVPNDAGSGHCTMSLYKALYVGEPSVPLATETRC